MTGVDIISLIVDIFQILAVLAIFYGYFISSKQGKVQYFLTRNKDVYNDEKTAKILYLVQNGKLKNDFIDDEHLFIAVNATLEFFTSICYVHRNKMIKTQDYLYYSIEIQHIVNTPAIKNYFDNLLVKSINLYLENNRIEEKYRDKFDYYGEFLPFLSLQLYAYMENHRCKLKQAEDYFNSKVRKEYERILTEINQAEAKNCQDSNISI